MSKTLAGRSLLGFHHKGRRGPSSDVGGDSMAIRHAPQNTDSPLSPPNLLMTGVRYEILASLLEDLAFNQ